MSRDLNHDLTIASTVAPAVLTSSVAAGSTIDLAGYSKAAFVATIGTITDGTFTFDPEDSPDGSTWTNIPAGLLSGAFVDADASHDDTIQKVGYIGEKRYIRCNIAVTGTPMTGGIIDVNVIRSGASTLPV